MYLYKDAYLGGEGLVLTSRHAEVCNTYSIYHYVNLYYLLQKCNFGVEVLDWSVMPRHTPFLSDTLLLMVLLFIAAHVQRGLRVDVCIPWCPE